MSVLPAGADRRDQFREAVTAGVVAHRVEHLARKALALVVGSDGDLDRRDRVGSVAVEGGQHPAADHAVPAVDRQLAAAEDERDRERLRHDLARVVLTDEDVVGEPVVDVAVERARRSGRVA